MKVASLITVVACTSACLAQDFTNLAAYKEAPAVKEAARKAEAMKTVLEMPQPAEGPVAKLDVNEFQLKQNDYIGKVVALTFDQVETLKQEGSSGYIARVTYEANSRPRNAGATPYVEIAFPAEGLKTFQEVYELSGSTRRTTVMVQILVASKTRALGERYREDEPEGQRYRW